MNKTGEGYSALPRFIDPFIDYSRAIIVQYKKVLCIKTFSIFVKSFGTLHIR